MSYVLGFDTKTESDKEFEIEGIPCVMNKAHELARKIDPKVNVMLWADMLDSYFMANWSGVLDEKQLDALYQQNVIARDILMMPWEYTGWAHSKKRGLQYMMSKGFPVVGAAGFKFDNNMLWGQVSRQLQTTRNEVKGILFTTWDSKQFEQWKEGLEAHAMMSWSPHRLQLDTCYELLQAVDQYGLARDEPAALPIELATRRHWQSLHARAMRDLKALDPAWIDRVQGLKDLQARIEALGPRIDAMKVIDE